MELVEIDFVTVTTSTDYDGYLVMPSNIRKGDIIIVAQQQVGSTTNDATGVGFTSISNLYYAGGGEVGNNYYKSHVSYRIASSDSLGGSTVGGFAQNNVYDHTSAVIAVFRPNVPATTVTQVDKYTYAGTSAGTNIMYASASDAVTIALSIIGSDNSPNISWTGSLLSVNTSIDNNLSDLRANMRGFDKGSGADITTYGFATGIDLFTSVLLEIT